MEKINYKNETNLNQDQLVSLLADQTLPFKKMLISICSIVILLGILIFFWDNETLGLFIALTVLLSIGLIGVILLLIGKKWLIKVSNKSLENGVKYLYTFYESGVKIESLLSGKNSVTQIQYNNLEKVVIKEDFIYLYANNVSIYFVDNNTFFDGKKEEVINLLKPYQVKKSKR